MSDKIRIETIISVFSRQEFPEDLLLIVVWLIAGIGVIYLPFLNTTVFRVLLALPVIIFIPGYCLIAALFPREDDIDHIERIALSFGFSIAVVPLIGLGLNFTPWGLRLDPIVISVTIFSLVMILVAQYRRAQIPPDKQFRMQFSTAVGRLYQDFLKPKENMADRLLNGVLLLVALVAVLTTIYVIVNPQEGEHYTEFFILNENRTAYGYPAQIIAGHNYPLSIGIGNHEIEASNYTIETWLMHTDFNNSTNTTRILAMDPSERLQLTLTDNETVIIPYNLLIQKTEYNRAEFLLFKGTPPGLDVTGSDRINASYRELHLWVTVRENSGPEI